MQTDPNSLRARSGGIFFWQCDGLGFLGFAQSGWTYVHNVSAIEETEFYFRLFDGLSITLSYFTFTFVYCPFSRLFSRKPVMRVQEPPYPSFTLALTKFNGSHHDSGDSSIHTEEYRSNQSPTDREGPLMTTVHYTYGEPPHCFTYSFDVVSHKLDPSTTSTLSTGREQRCSLITRVLNILTSVWNRVWKRLTTGRAKRTTVDLPPRARTSVLSEPRLKVLER